MPCFIPNNWCHERNWKWCANVDVQYQEPQAVFRALSHLLLSRIFHPPNKIRIPFLLSQSLMAMAMRNLKLLSVSIRNLHQTTEHRIKGNSSNKYIERERDQFCLWFWSSCCVAAGLAPPSFSHPSFHRTPSHITLEGLQAAAERSPTRWLLRRANQTRPEFVPSSAHAQIEAFFFEPGVAKNHHLLGGCQGEKEKGDVPLVDPRRMNEKGPQEGGPLTALHEGHLSTSRWDCGLKL